MSRICPLFSGSTGNATYIADKCASLLVDAGASMKAISEEIERAGGCIDEISAVVVTHEHIDHIKGLKPILKRSGARLVASEKTLEALIADDKVPANVETVCINEYSIDIDGIVINRFATSHDCEGSSGYSFILSDNKKISVCTDLGIITAEVRKGIMKSDLVLLESNHDIEMLKRGPYPPQLKMRIMSERGHISNNVCAAELVRLFKDGTLRFILGHLSLNNNTPLLAKSCSQAALIDLGAENGKDYILSVAKPKNNGVMIL